MLYGYRLLHCRTDDICKDITEDSETRFYTSNYSLDRPLPKEKNKRVVGLMKDKFGGKVMTKFVGLRAKTCSYLLDDGSGDKKARGTETCVVKRKPKFKNNKTV